MQRIVLDEKQYAVKCYEIFYKDRDYQSELAHYFRNLYHIVKFVNEAEVLKRNDAAIDYKERRRYTSLVRAQLSAYELALLFYDGLSKYGEGFKPLIEKFGLLEHLDAEHLLLDPSHKAFYDSSAFR
jgi:hypothetical protein